MPRKPKKNFENALQELDTLIKQLELGELSLEDSIKAYKEGMELASYCNSVLKQAEQEIYVYEEENYKKLNGEETYES